VPAPGPQLSALKRPTWLHVTMGVSLIVVAVALGVGWQILGAEDALRARELATVRFVVYLLGLLLFLLLIAGLALNSILLVREVRLNERQSNFVSAVTHELKTPLSLMSLVAESLVTGRYKEPEKIPAYGELLSAEVARMTQLIDNLLSFARLNRVDNFYMPAPVDLTELLEEASVNFRSRLAQLNLTLTIETGVEIISLHADRTALLLAIDNLLDNAIKYSSGSVTRAIALRGRLEDDVVIIEVEDQGSGIHEEDLPRVMEKFFRGRQARGGGTGLGLAIVNQIVSDHGGRVDIRSAAGRGTTVVISLPRAGHSPTSGLKQ
jgi:two-component system phosphate regulon sensor histidine kinase PhoR